MKLMLQVIKLKSKILTVLLFLAAIVLAGSCQNNSATESSAMAKKGMVPVNGSTFKTENGWGYNITVDNKLFIKQTEIPVVEGNKGFATEEDAAKVAQLVINKIAKNESPAVKKEDLEKLGIIK
jgi:hypothetical protein